MAISNRTRTKGIEAAGKLLPPGTQIRDYVVGRGHFRMTTGAIVATGIFAAAFVIALMLGMILIPGGLLVIYAFSEVRPPLAVAATEQGLAVLKRSLWNNKPTKVLALLPPAPVGGAPAGGSVTIALGPEHVTLAKGEYQRLAAAAATPPATGYPTAAFDPASPGIVLPGSSTPAPPELPRF